MFKNLNTIVKEGVFWSSYVSTTNKHCILKTPFLKYLVFSYFRAPLTVIEFNWESWLILRNLFMKTWIIPKSVKFVCQGAHGTYFRLCVSDRFHLHYWNLPLHSGHRHSARDWSWTCSTKTSFAKINSRLDLVLALWFPFPQYTVTEMSWKS